MARNTFSDPLGHVADYPWPVNHATEQKVGRGQAVQRSMNVAGTQLITAQGDIGALQLVLQGSILTRDQLVAMLAWQALTENRTDAAGNLIPAQTIFFTDFSGDSYEVLITDFQPVKVAGRNRRGEATGNPLWYWTYSLTMDVVNVRGGVYYDAGVRS